MIPIPTLTHYVQNLCIDYFLWKRFRYSKREEFIVSISNSINVKSTFDMQFNVELNELECRKQYLNFINRLKKNANEEETVI